MIFKISKPTKTRYMKFTSSHVLLSAHFVIPPWKTNPTLLWLCRSVTYYFITINSLVLRVYRIMASGLLKADDTPFFEYKRQACQKHKLHYLFLFFNLAILLGRSKSYSSNWISSDTRLSLAEICFVWHIVFRLLGLKISDVHCVAYNGHHL